MIRFYKSYLGRMLLGLLLLIEMERASGKNAVVAIVNTWAGGSTMERHIVESATDLYLNGYPDESPSNADVLQGAFGQMLKNKSQDGDLLDQVVMMIGLPIVNYFNVNTLKNLRDAILTPFELTQLKESFKDCKKCTCGHEFKAGEMASVNIGDNAMTVSCNRCVRASTVRCDYCDEQVPLTAKVGASLRNTGVDCGCRKRKVEAAEAEATTTGAGAVPLPMARGIRHTRTPGWRELRVGTPAPATPTMTVQAMADYMQAVQDAANPAGNPVDDGNPV